jgi:lysyl-tRNA synthetase class 2
MASIEEIREARLAKIELLKQAGMNPYPAAVPRDFSLAETSKQFSTLAESGEAKSIAGRIVAMRGQGAIQFIVLQEGKDQFQVVVKKDEIDADKLDLFNNTVDLGDFVSFTGTFFTTERGQQSLQAIDWQMASKSLRPLPEKFHGLTDQDTKYRQRYLDTITDPEVFDRFIMRSKITKAIRRYMEDELDFIEVDTPILQNQAGGAMADVFHTHHNALDQDMVLRIAVELDHKMMMAGGYDRIFEVARMFRNEGMDPTHLQEFTMIEWYAAWATLEDNLQWTEDMLKYIAQDVVGKTSFSVLDKDGNEHTVHFDGNWERAYFNDLIKQHANIDAVTISDEDARAAAVQWGMDPEDAKTTGRANLLDHVYKKSARANIIQPPSVMGYPSDLKPLATPNPDGTAQVAQLVIAGTEITNQYGELVNPIKQRELLEAQAKAKAAGDKEAMDIDERFLTAMEHGMPPMTGFGMGVDRLVAIMTEQRTLRDVVFFPTMKPKD